MSQVSLRGITWNHSRALTPLVATAQRFEDQNPKVRIQWEKRSLHDFGHADLRTLANNFDLLVIDHPMVGDVAASGMLIDLIPRLSSIQLNGLRDDSLGLCFESYLHQGRLYALPIDAAAPAASFRPDLLSRSGTTEPKSWTDVVALARTGCVRMPAFSADIFLNFMGLCISQGSAVAAGPEQLFDPVISAQCLERLRELADLMPKEIYGMNPIALYERMTAEDNIAYCPFAYTYSNYSRGGFGKKRIRFSNPVSLGENMPMRTVLGGTGIAISAGCRDIPLALEYSVFVAGRISQRTLYAVCGGQPARRSAWHDPMLNRLTDNFFLRTVRSIETAYLRPQYCGYVALQERAGEAIAECCQYRTNTKQTLDKIDDLYRASLRAGLQHA